ncbi:putative baseplate assembly protein (plasmid) [Cereibacter azotoformans]|uniref:putative baseplate assembly protein n=1 Tax=Cereibacter azotoformans TaxID=43057 RepID=UPI003B210D76
MPLPSPPLDSRTFKDLLDEARARLPRYTPEWTNFNDSDPGMALVQLHAWMTETILYELNRVPELNYLRFLDLLGIRPEPARPARTELTFTLKDPVRVGVSIPRLTRVGVEDLEVPSDLVFETDRTLAALDAAVGALVVARPAPSGGHGRDLVTRFEKGVTSWAYSFDPFGRQEGPVALHLGLRLRPGREDKSDDYSEDRFPAGPLDLFVDAVGVGDPGAGDGAGIVEGPIGTACPPPGAAGVPLDHLVWHVFTGTGDEPDPFSDPEASAGWTRLALTEDGTAALSGSGHLVFEMPAAVTPLDPMKLSAGFWSSFGAVRPPRDRGDLVEQLREGPLEILEGLADHWTKMGATEAELDEVAACGEDPGAVADLIEEAGPGGFALDPSRLTLADWIKVNEGYRAALPRNDRGYLPLYWLRALLRPPGEAAPPVALRGFHLNTVPATQAATRLDDRLGRSNGRPAQEFRLPKGPVLIDPASGAPDLDLEIAEQGQAPGWQRVEDFHLSGPESPHYLLDPATGTIRLGDGRRGRIPVAGAAVTAVRYRVGGGRAGNAGAGLVTKLKGGLRDVKGVTNLRAAHDGSDAEPLDEVKLRAPHDLRMRDRAVSAADFADLAMRTPGVALHSAHALPRRAVGAAGLVEKDGAVTLVVVPRLAQAMPQPSEDQKRAICRWLEPRRLITTELHISGPDYVRVARLSARLTVARDRDLAQVTEAVAAALVGFFSPFTGGEAGTGWTFGADIALGDLYARMLGVAGVRRASHLAIALEGQPAPSGDVVPVPEGHLPSLGRDAVDLVAAHD